MPGTRDALTQSLNDNAVNPVLFYHPEGFTTTGNRLMGRQAAGESFLKAYCRYTDFSTVWCTAPDEQSAAVFKKQVQTYSAQQKVGDWIPADRPEKLEAQGCLFLPGPGLGSYAWQRRRFSQRAYSLCGITHTTASARAMDQLGDLLIAPVQPWDALICTSHSVKAMVEVLLDDYREYLSQKFGRVSVQNSVKNPVQLPVIPLGVDAEAFKPNAARQAQGKILREDLKLPKDAVVFLFMGRLSFHAKAHPYPMMVALEQAARMTGKKVGLILAGWFANAAIQEEFVRASRLLCPSVQVCYVDARQPEVKETVWAAADVFTSLSDNIQETFGLTPIEAKAAGLPVVVSDWDGYRETVRPGEDGFLIPTRMPPAGCGEDLAWRHAMELDNYDHYIGKVGQTTAVDIDACIQAYVTLIQNPDLRRQMGVNGQADVQARYHWPVVLNAYQALWTELADIRAAAVESAPLSAGRAAHPLRMDPYRLFQNYPSHPLDEQTVMAVDDPARLQAVQALSMTQVAKEMLCTPEQAQRLLAILSEHKTLTITELAALSESISMPQLYPILGWLMKMGLVACR